MTYDGTDADDDGVVEANVDNESVSTENALTDVASGVSLGPHQNRLKSAKADWSWADISWEDKGSPIIDGSSLTGDAGWASYLHAESVLDSPIDTHYLYWSGHNSNDIYLSTASSLWGSWTSQGSVLSDSEGGQTASPSILADLQNNRLLLYYHVNPDGQFTKYATTTDLSGDGTSFSIGGTALGLPDTDRWDKRERSYMNVYRRANEYVAVYQGRWAPNMPGVGVAHSFDGETFEAEPTPAWDSTQWSTISPQSFTGGSPILSSMTNDWSLLYSDDGTDNIHALPFSSRDAAIHQAGEVVYTPPSWTSSGDKIIPNATIVGDEYLYLVYSHNPGTADRSVGIARASRGGLYA